MTIPNEALETIVSNNVVDIAPHLESYTQEKFCAPGDGPAAFSAKELGVARAWIRLLAQEVRALRRRIANAEAVLDFYDGEPNVAERGLDALANSDDEYEVDDFVSHYVDAAHLGRWENGRQVFECWRENGKWYDDDPRITEEDPWSSRKK